MNNGYILHQDAERVVIATGITDPSQNEKTGPMIQVWILVKDQSPLAAIRTGDDYLVCGDCKHREGSCYVNVAQAPQSIWHAYQRGSYEFLPRSSYPEVFAGRMVRFGAYGDPSYIPVDVLRWVAFFSAGWTGYTHQWRHNPQLSGYLMASVDNMSEYALATDAGWRTFRVRTELEALVAGEIMCPASDEGGKRTQCNDCGLCDGVRYSPEQRKSIAIVAHGISPKVAAFNLIQIGGAN